MAGRSVLPCRGNTQGKTTMRKSIIALSLLGAVLGIASVPADAASRRPAGPVRFVDTQWQRPRLSVLQEGRHGHLRLQLLPSGAVQRLPDAAGPPLLRRQSVGDR